MAAQKQGKHEKETKSLHPRIPVTAAVFVMVLNILLMLGITFVADSVKTMNEMMLSMNKIVSSLQKSDQMTNELLRNYETSLRREILFAGRLIGDGTFTDRDARAIADWLQERDFAILDEYGEVISTTFSSSYLFEHGRELADQAKEEITGQQLYYRDEEEHQYHPCVMYENRYGVIRRPAADLDRYIQETVTVSQLVERMYTENTILLMAKDGVLFYAPEKSSLKDGMTESEFLDLLTDFYPSRAINEYFAGGMIEKQKYLILKLNLSDHYEGYAVYLGLTMNSYLRQSWDTILIFAPVMLAVMTVSLFYLYQLKREPYEKRRDSRKLTRIRILVTVLVSWLILTLTAFFARSISCLSAFVMNHPQELSEIEKVYEDAQVRAMDLKQTFNAFAMRNAKLIQNYMNDFPSRRQEETYRALSEMFRLDYICQFDREGKQTATDGGFTGLVLSTRKKDASYAFRPILKGVDTVLQEPMYDDLSCQNHQVIGVCLRDQNGRPDGLLQIAFSAPGMDSLLSGTELSAVLEQTINTVENSYYLIDPQSKIFLYSPFGEITGDSASERGFTEKMISPDYSGYFRIDGVRYYLSCSEIAGKYLYIAVPAANIYGDRWKFTQWVSLAVLAEYLLYLILLLKVHPRTEQEVQQESKTEETARTGWLFNRLPVREAEEELSAVEKTARVFRYVSSALILLLAIAILFRDEVFGRNSILSFVMQGDWKPGLNIFAFTAILITMIFMLAAVAILREILTLLARILNPGGETLCRLFLSAAEYFAFFASLFLILQFLGVNVRTLMTSAGILTLIVGLGANNLIADTIAGLFLIFEEEFQVGDVIEVGGQTGIVKEIGIHSATLLDENNNVVILNNSKVTDIIRHSEGKSFASLSFRISADVSADRIEELLEEKLAELEGTIDGMIGKPYFRGITALENRMMTFLVVAETDEMKKKAVQTALYPKVVQILHSDDIELL